MKEHENEVHNEREDNRFESTTSKASPKPCINIYFYA